MNSGRYVYACDEFDGAGQCSETVWIPHSSEPPGPTIAEASQIGGALFLGCALIAAARLFVPSRKE